MHNPDCSSPAIREQLLQGGSRVRGTTRAGIHVGLVHGHPALSRELPDCFRLGRNFAERAGFGRERSTAICNGLFHTAIPSAAFGAISACHCLKAPLRCAFEGTRLILMTPSMRKGSLLVLDMVCTGTEPISVTL